MKGITTDRLVIRHPEVDDAERLIAFEKKNEEHFAQWQSTTGESIKSLGDQALVIEQWESEHSKGQSRRYIMLEKGNEVGSVLGVCNFSNIVYGAFLACYLGYRIDKEFEGQGLMREALVAIIEDVVKELGLHRIMANYVPENERSKKLLDSLGFEVEGRARKYLKINGKWEDHILTAKIIE